MSAPSIRARIVRTLVTAAIGAAIGYLVAYRTLPPDIMANSSLPGLYATGGAAIMILGARLAAVFVLIWREFRGKRAGEGD